VLRSPVLLRRVLVVLLAVAALGATSACDGVTPNAATVGSHAVTRKVLFEDLDAEAKAAAKAGANQVGADGNPLSSPVGDVADSYTTAASATALTNRVHDLLFGEILKELHTSVTAADTTAAKNALCADATTGQPAADGSCAALDSYPAAYRSFLLAKQARSAAFQTALLKRSYPEVKAKAPSALRQVCFNAAGVADDATAKQIVAAVTGGATLTAAADAANKGAASAKAGTPQPVCLYLTDAPDSILKASTGQATQVTNGQGNLFVVQVTGRQAATAAEFAASPPRNDTAMSKIVEALFEKLARHIPISVDPRFGTWDLKNLSVVAPDRPAGMAPTTTSPLTALGGSTPTP